MKDKQPFEDLERQLSDLGDQINQTVKDALHSEGFEELKDSVRSVGKEVGRSVKRSVRESVRESKRKSYVKKVPAPMEPQAVVRVMHKPAGNVSGVLMQVFGLLGAIPTSIALLVMTVLFLAGPMGAIPYAIAASCTAPVCLGSIVLTACGKSRRRRAQRFMRYQAQLGSDPYCSIQQLAASVGESKDFVVKDLRKMIQRGMFPEGHIDEQQTCLMVTNETYHQYLQAQESAKRRLQGEEQKQESGAQENDLEAAIAEGRDYIWQIREADRAIPEPEISEELNRLGEISSKIFSHVESHPEKLPEIRRFMQYYLPTTLKLVKAYREFSEQPVQGENISNTKLEICRALHTINQAFENLLDSLFQNEALDISTDISALKTMLAQEGLTEDQFHK